MAVETEMSVGEGCGKIIFILAWFLHFAVGSRDSELEKLRSLLWASSDEKCWERPLWAGRLALAW